MDAVGRHIGTYTIVARLGAGAMGEVYRARDARLGRDVAIKLLPAAFAADRDRLARFEREARAMAALNHPNVGAIYGFETLDGLSALVLELVPGESLAATVARGPLPLATALTYAQQIAGALDAAHDKGIVHRDLKPANIMITPDGVVKVLDFGLAKSPAPESSEHLEASTVTSDGTKAGVVMGTAAYMSPEQARGLPVDKRTDIWAFGCVLFEMLAARRPFGGETVSDVVANILKSEPDWNALPPAAAPVKRLLRACLEKDVKQRVRDIGDVGLLLENQSDAAAAPVSAQVARPTRTMWIIAGAISGLLVGGAAVKLTDRQPSVVSSPGARFELTMAADEPLATASAGTNVAISPDGARIVYTSTRGGDPELVIRRLDELESTPIPGSADGMQPFFSPDGRELGFATFNELKRVSLAGGSIATICPVDAYFSGASWASDNTIIYTQSAMGLFRVPAFGGPSRVIATPDPAKQEQAFMAPVVLPGGQAILYTAVLLDGATRIMARRLAGGDAVTIVDGGLGPLYSASGHLVFIQGDRVMAARFDLAAMRVDGAPISIQGGAFAKGTDGVSNIALAENGTAIYVSGHNTAGMGRLVWVDRHGARTGIAVDDVLEYPRNPRLSPDGKRLALTVGRPGYGQIWVYDLARPAEPLKLTFQDHNLFPVWSPDGKQIAFLRRAGSASHLFSIAADGSAVQGQLLSPQDLLGVPVAWSPASDFVLYQGSAPAKIWLLRLRDQHLQPWLQTPLSEFAASFSPDGQWLAFGSNQTGPTEIWVRPFPGPGAPVRISSGGGRKPMWSKDGAEILYENGAQVMSARVTALAPSFRADTPRLLFTNTFVRDDTDPLIRFLDPAADGRFLGVEASQSAKPPAVIVALQWDEVLKRAFAAK